MSVKEQLLKARELIKARKFAEARAILTQLDDDTAREWLYQLNQIDPPPPKPPKPQRDPKRATQPRRPVQPAQQPSKERPPTQPRRPSQTRTDTQPRRPTQPIKPVSGSSSTPRVMIAVLVVMLLAGAAVIGGLFFFVSDSNAPGQQQTVAALASTADAATAIAAAATEEPTATDAAPPTEEPTPTDDTTPTETAIPTQTLPPTETPEPSDTLEPTATGTLPPTESPTPTPTRTPSITPTPVAAGAATYAGFDVPFLQGNRLISVPIPEGWACYCDDQPSLLQPAEDISGQVEITLLERRSDPDVFIGAPLDEIADIDLGRDGDTVSGEYLEAGERQVFLVTVGNERRYYVNDSDGHALVLRVPGTVEDPARLQDEVLVVAAGIEGERADAAQAFFEQLPEEFETGIAYNPELDRWRTPSANTSEREYTLTLPQGWALVDEGVAALSTSLDTTRTTFTYYDFAERDPSAAFDIAQVGAGVIAEAGLRGANTTELEVEGRPIFRALTGTRALYLVRDTSGDFISLNVNTAVEAGSDLDADLLAMAASIETAPITYQSRLIRAGLVEDAPPDGYEFQ